jgi:tRNA A37 methylthiotransferase MiaB
VFITSSSLLPDVTISSDFISGFCSETEEEHRDTISLLQEVKYDQAFMVRGVSFILPIIP